MYSRENYAQAKAEIEQRRLNAIAKADERNREVALESEEIRKIDAELSATGLLLFKTAMTGGDVDTVRARNEELNAKRRELLKSMGYPEDYTEPQYVFKICRDKYGENNDRFISDHYALRTTVTIGYREYHYPDSTENGFDGDMVVVAE